MNEAGLLEFVHIGRESRNLEYKASRPWTESDFRAKLTRAIIGLSNIRGGGVVVVGVDEHEETFSPTGMDAECAATYRQDDVSDYVNKYADPPVELTVSQVSEKDRTFVVIQVREFYEFPVVCKRDRPPQLRRGALYTRSLSKNETCETKSQNEMREILQMALRKQFSTFRSMVDDTGLSLNDSDASLDRKWRSEIESVPHVSLLDDIHSTGYWRVNLRPTEYNPHNIDTLSACRQIAKESSVLLRGWAYPPCFDEEISNGQNHIWAESNFMGHKEVWHLFQSGQFCHEFALLEEYDVEFWERKATRKAPNPNVLWVWSNLWTVTEVFLFASSLASAGLFSPMAEIRLELYGTLDRTLCFERVGDRSSPEHRCKLKSVSFSERFSQDDLIEQPLELAVSAFSYLVERFHWSNPQREVLRNEQLKLVNRDLI